MRKKIGVDICNTVADVNSLVASVLGLPLSVFTEEYSMGRFAKDPEAWFETHPEVFAEALPMPGAFDALDRLASKAEIVYVTARPVWARSITLEWLGKWGFPRGLLVMGEPKDAVASALGLSAFVEDAPREVRALRRVCPVFTVGWPYNGSILDWVDVERGLRMLLSACIMEVKVGERDARDRHAETPGRKAG